MGNWTIYLAPDEEKLLKKKLQEIANRNRWSFSQAVSGVLREHLIEEKKKLADDVLWNLLSAQSFFEGSAEKDAIYDTL